MTEEEKMIDTYVGSDFSIVCRPTGCLDWTGAAALRHAVHNVLCPEINLHIDLRHLNFVDAVGMSALVGSVRRVRAVGGKARIQNARDDRGPIGPRVCVVVRWRRVMTASVPSGPWPRCSGSSWSSRGLDIFESVATQPFNPIWGLGLATGILEVGLGFWASQQFFPGRALLLLLWVGFYAMSRGFSEIVLAFQLRPKK